ncbi:hypothetical protein J7J47_10375 [Halomonas sp. ISL-60]|uniref:hypothetical protein n=1 Tax=Halomonas sp. ISL-56 TaxID=2819149 RepID=UPI001BEC72C2|nr:hypothetical protein [Halomonas sp. ISL-56]MBT2772636.1 hypothetical protein [Halomonas sp. ISL-60]MBT2802024.1 hypothetical protein [Halomonas sp. ISL-56]
MEEDGTLIRLFPVPFRLITGDQQFSKWQWITAKIEKSRDDHRPESHKLKVGSIRLGNIVSPDRNWKNRRHYLEKLRVFDSPDDLELARQNDGTSIGLVRVQKIQDLTLTEHKHKDWTDEERSKLESSQLSLLDDDIEEVKILEKIPVDFHYHYECSFTTGSASFKHKIVDWEIGALYRKLIKFHGLDDWKRPFKQKLLEDLPAKDLMFLMGTVHRFPGQWLIISLIYPPKQPQQSLF